MGDVSKTSEFIAGLFRGRSEGVDARLVVRAQAALFARGRQRDVGQRRRHADRTAGPLWSRRLYPAGVRAAAEQLRSVRGHRKLAGRSYALRPVDSRG